MTYEEKAEAMVSAYPELRDSSVGRAVIVDTITLLRNERQELLAGLKTAIDDLSYKVVETVTGET